MWSVTVNDYVDWPISFAALLMYCKEHGTCNIVSSAHYECMLEGMGENHTTFHYQGNLGRWLSNQRTSKKGTSRYKLTPEKEALLQALVDAGIHTTHTQYSTYVYKIVYIYGRLH